MSPSNKTDINKLINLKDKEINYSDIPKTDATFWKDAEVIYPSNKTHLSIRLDDDIVNWFKKYTEVSIEGKLKEIWSYYHTKFSGWDYSQTMHAVPFDKAWLQNSHKELYKNNKMISFEVEPLEIKIEGNFAIIHVNCVEKLKDSDGNEITYSVPWTSALIKQDGKWLFLSWSFTLK